LAIKSNSREATDAELKRGGVTSRRYLKHLMRLSKKLQKPARCAHCPLHGVCLRCSPERNSVNAAGRTVKVKDKDRKVNDQDHPILASCWEPL